MMAVAAPKLALMIAVCVPLLMAFAAAFFAARALFRRYPDRRLFVTARPVLAALAFHLVLLVLACGVLFTVVPRFMAVYADMGSHLPLVTRWFVGVVCGLQHWIVVVFPLALAGDAAICFVAQQVGGRRVLYGWVGIVALALGLFLAAMPFALFLPLRSVVQQLNQEAPGQPAAAPLPELPAALSPPGATLEFRPGEAAPRAGLAEMTVEGSDRKVYLRAPVALSSADLQSGSVESDRTGTRIRLVLKPAGAATFAAVTEECIGKPLGIVVDGKLLSAPMVRERIPGGVIEIAGPFTPAEASRILERLAPRPSR